MKIEWRKIESEYKLQNPPDFVTHLNYVSCLNEVSKGINASCNVSIKNKIEESKYLGKKVNLIKLTRKSIEGEYSTILKHPDFAELCIPWISVKTYYLIFNLLLILDYLITGQESSFNLGHEKAVNKFKEYLSNNQLIFNKNIFNNNFPCLSIIKLKVKSGANIKIMNFDLNGRVIQILKKLVAYKLQEFKRKERIKNFRSKRNSEKKRQFLQTNTINIFEFFYWYRIKANYKDLEFLNQDVSDYKFSEFYQNYFELTLTFSNMFKGLINGLAEIRLGKTIL